MPLWLFVALIVINTLSLVALYVIQKNVAHVTRSHIRIMGKENTQYIQTTALSTVRAAYALLIIGFAAGSFIFLRMYTS